MNDPRSPTLAAWVQEESIPQSGPSRPHHDPDGSWTRTPHLMHEAVRIGWCGRTLLRHCRTTIRGLMVACNARICQAHRHSGSAGRLGVGTGFYRWGAAPVLLAIWNPIGSAQISRPADRW